MRKRILYHCLDGMTESLFSLLGALLFAGLLFQAVRKAAFTFSRIWNAGKLPALLWIFFSLLFLFGCTGFFAQCALSLGLLPLSEHCEWPIHKAVRAVPLEDGGFAVPLQAVGRVQIYDEHWKFVRGWQAPALGAPFQLDLMLDGSLRVRNSRQQARFYSQDGHALEAKNSSRFDAGEAIGALPLDVPVRLTTNPPQLIFASRLASWCVAAFGALGAFLIGRLAYSGGY